MKFNGDVWMKIPVTQKLDGEPDEFVIVKNEKSTGGVIGYARYGDNWTTSIPNKILIRELMLKLDAKSPETSFCDNCEKPIPVELLACCSECGRVYEINE